MNQDYTRPEADIIEIRECSAICVKGSSSNENYNEKPFNW